MVGAGLGPAVGATVGATVGCIAASTVLMTATSASHALSGPLIGVDVRLIRAVVLLARAKANAAVRDDVPKVCRQQRHDVACTRWLRG